MSNWHDPICTRPDVKVGEGGALFCWSCGALVSAEDFEASEASQLPPLPPTKPRSHMNLTWPSSIEYSPTCILDDTGHDLTPQLVQRLEELTPKVAQLPDDPGSSGRPPGKQNTVDHTAYTPDFCGSRVIDAITSGESSPESPPYPETPQGSVSRVPTFQQGKTTLPALVDANDIRLLHLSKGGPNEPLHGSLELANLKHLLYSQQFEALSYTWADKNGSSARCRKLFLGPAWNEFPITANCDAALRRLRYRDGKRVIWVDSICINQDDNDERSHQVQKMCEIYAAAFRVMIYIGGNDADSTIAMSMIAGAYDPRDADIGNVKFAGLAIQKFFERPYFSRIWVIQEIAMARSAIVYCGADSLCWSKFHLSALEKIGVRAVTFPTWIEHFDRPRHRVMENFPQLLLDTSACKSSDPRDKVFALLGLIMGANQEGLLADYSLSVEQVYTGLAASLLINHPSCNILRYRNSNPLLPSWVPDWRRLPSIPDIQNIFQIDLFTSEIHYATYTAAEWSIPGGSDCLSCRKKVSCPKKPSCPKKVLLHSHDYTRKKYRENALLARSLQSIASPASPKTPRIHKSTGALAIQGYRLANLASFECLKSKSYQSIRGLTAEWTVLYNPVAEFVWFIALKENFVTSLSIPFDYDLVFLDEYDIFLLLQKQRLTNTYRIVGECAAAAVVREFDQPKPPEVRDRNSTDSFHSRNDITNKLSCFPKEETAKPTRNLRVMYEQFMSIAGKEIWLKWLKLEQKVAYEGEKSPLRGAGPSLILLRLRRLIRVPQLSLIDALDELTHATWESIQIEHGWNYRVRFGWKYRDDLISYNIARAQWKYRKYLNGLIPHCENRKLLMDAIAALWVGSFLLFTILTDVDLFPVSQGGQGVDSAEKPQTDRILDQIFNNIVGSSKSGRSIDGTISTPTSLRTRMRSLVELFDRFESSDNSQEQKSFIERTPSLSKEVIGRDVWTLQQIIII